MKRKKYDLSIETTTFTIGGNRVSLDDKIDGLVIDEEIGWTNKEGEKMRPTRCEWDFSDFPLHEMIRLAWNNFKVEVRSKFFQKIVEEGGFDLLHEETGDDKTIRAIDALAYKVAPQDIHAQINRAVEKERINTVCILLDMGNKREDIIRTLSKRFQCSREECEHYYRKALEDR